MNSPILWLRIIPFLLLAIAPFVLTGRLCQRVSAAQERGDVATGWFGYARAMGWVATGFWFSWVIGVLLLNPWRELAVALEWREVPGAAFHNALTILPPALILAVCEVMAYPVVQRVRGLDFPLSGIVVDAFIGRLWLTLPAALLWTGFQTMPLMKHRHTLVPMAFAIAGIFSLLAIQIFWLRKRTKETFTPHAVSVGALRDRAFTLAEKAGITLRQIYVFPMARWRLANAYASEQNTLLLTDWLLRHLSTREVDAVIAHELAHMKRGHASKQALLLMVLWAAPIVWFRLHDTMPDLAWVVFWFLASWHLTLLISGLVSRRHEREADAQGIAIGQDPEAFISALARIGQLNAMPHELSRLDENFSTHPSTRRRVEAVAQVAALNKERIDQLLSNRESDPSRYALPESVEAATQGDGPVFDTTLKHKIVNRFTGTYLFALGLPPVAIAWVAVQWPNPGVQCLICVIGLALYAGLIVLVLDRTGRKLQSRLRDRIATRLSSKVGAIKREAPFVGLSPGPQVRLYEGCHNWDLGFLLVEPDCLRYVGEQTRFALFRPQIRQIRLGPGAPRWLRTQNVYIDWFEAAQAVGGTFSLSNVGKNSFYADGRASALLAASLDQWFRLAGSATAPRPPITGGDFEPPQFGEITSSSIRASVRPKQLALALMMTLAPTIGVIAGSELHRRSLFAAGFAILAVVAGHAFASVPHWRHRDG